MGAYIFLGPELGKKNNAVDLVRKDFPAAEEFSFYFGETPARVIADTLLNISLFADSRIVIVKNAELIKKEDDISLLVSCIKSIEKTTALILLSDENKISSVLDNAVPKDNKQVFYELYEREKSEWLASFFKKEGFNINREAIAVILEMVENNTEALKRECSRLVYFLPKDRPVTAEDIEKWLAHNREESVFTLFSRIACGDISKSLESMSSMLAAKESAQKILAGLAWCFRKLDDYLTLQEKGEVSFLDLKKIGLSVPNTRDNYTAAARRYNSDAVEQCLALTAEYELLLRSPVSVMENILMDRYIVSIINTAQRNLQ